MYQYITNNHRNKQCLYKNLNRYKYKMLCFLSCHIYTLVSQSQQSYLHIDESKPLNGEKANMSFKKSCLRKYCVHFIKISIHVERINSYFCKKMKNLVRHIMSFIVVWQPSTCTHYTCIVVGLLVLSCISLSGFSSDSATSGLYLHSCITGSFNIFCITSYSQNMDISLLLSFNI